MGRAHCECGVERGCGARAHAVAAAAAPERTPLASLRGPAPVVAAAPEATAAAATWSNRAARELGSAVVGRAPARS